ncbi:MAG: hypothetical protein JO019_01545 [Candidatus Kaiserbacteria bacterium]|nr:hypothetical protein [Candidatus Kaiserbacteria bacterium]
MAEYNGRFTIELAAEAKEDAVPNTLKVSGRTVTVENGRFRASKLGPEFKIEGGMPFFLAACLVVAVRDANGGQIWPKQ